MKIIRVIVIIIILVPIILWVALGPALSSFLNARASDIADEVKQRSDGNLQIDSISGDFWSGIRLEKVVVYTDKDLSYLPLIVADEVIVHLSLINLLQKDFTPVSVHISGFNAALHIEPDGTIALPEWTLAGNHNLYAPIRAGFAVSPNLDGNIHITWEDGILEIHKRFTNLTESVDVVFTQLEGSGNFIMDEGFEIESLTGDYLSTPVTVEGYVPNDKNEQIDITATIGDVRFNTIFRDIDPLFRGNQYLPDGIASVNIILTGRSEAIAVKGSMNLTDASVGNLKIDSATASISYNAGVIDLSEGIIQAYGGRANATGRINLLSANPLWDVICTFEELDLPEYLNENNYFSNEMTGNFAGSIEAHGDFANPDLLECTMEIECLNGSYLSPFSDRFIEMATGVSDDSVISESDMTVFNELTIRARIAQSDILVEQFHFISNDLQVEANGTVGFDKSINARGGLSVPLDKARRHPDFGHYISFLPDTLNRASLEFTLSGYIYNLKFNASPSDNLLRGLLDQGSDAAHGLGDSFTPIN